MKAPRLRLRTLLVIVTVLAVVLTAVKYVSDWDFQLKSEYSAARVISDTTKFVESRKGRWPADWSDIPGGIDASKYVSMRFDVTADELAANPESIYEAIQPKSGEYRTYPHAEEQLDNLRQSVLRFRASPPPDANSNH